MPLDTPKFKAVLAQKSLPQWKLAVKLGYRPSTMSDWIRGARPAPEDLIQRMERELKLAPGTLNLTH